MILGNFNPYNVFSAISKMLRATEVLQGHCDQWIFHWKLWFWGCDVSSAALLVLKACNNRSECFIHLCKHTLQSQLNTRLFTDPILDERSHLMQYLCQAFHKLILSVYECWIWCFLHHIYTLTPTTTQEWKVSHTICKIDWWFIFNKYTAAEKYHSKCSFNLNF